MITIRAFFLIAFVVVVLIFSSAIYDLIKTSLGVSHA